ncbi:MAG: 3-deoxy-D-manno-octulosonic acid transferase [Candidatus Omnitrophota bacterium]|jgi:3-deoxy-D-manno-octulosonic-acid transferase
MLYSIAFFIFSLIYLPTLIFKGKFHADLGQRFARFDRMTERALLSGNGRIWIQAVSVGEVALCRSLIPALKEKFPDRDIVVSTITKAGNDLAKRIFVRDAIVIYFPLDFRFIVRKTINIVKPALYIMIETEIWPNLLRELSAAGVPAALINGRISDRSIGKYRIVKPFLKKTLEHINVFCMQDKIDAERILGLGAPADKVKVTGNMKFDARMPADIQDPGLVRSSIGLKEDEVLIVAGSTHEGEEAIVLDVFKSISCDIPKLRLLIAPRHVNRSDAIEKLIKSKGFECARFSTPPGLPRTTAGAGNTQQIILLDTIGHLNEMYSIATIVFIGGSLVKYGGHNPIEPAYFGKAILFGPHMFNFKYITGVFLKNKAAIQVPDKEGLEKECRRVLKDAGARDALGKNAKHSIAENSGASDKNILEITGILK